MAASMLLFLISSFYLVFLSKSLCLPPPPSWVIEMRFLSASFWQELIRLILHLSMNGPALCLGLIKYIALSSEIPTRKKMTVGEGCPQREGFSLLDLPELALENIISRLPPNGLHNMAGVCSSLKERCSSDYFWERHMREKWGRLIGPKGLDSWKHFVLSRRDSPGSPFSKCRGWLKSLCSMWSSMVGCHFGDELTPLPSESIMSCYLFLENGKFWFPAQVYNRESGHLGFLMSCYDAEICYDPQTDTFDARYPPHGRRPIVNEQRVEWARIRAPATDTSTHELHISACLNDLHPGDHIEIQWRRNKEFPYGWWYGVVGHLESCDGNQRLCSCHKSDTVVLEFNHYAHGSRWRCTAISRHDHREKGNESDGFYGGIRKLYDDGEITKWKKLWPEQALE